MNKISVILADDHAIVRDGLRYLLEAQKDLKVVGSACDGRDTVKLVLEKDPHIVLMDIAMPGLNGIETTRIITRDNPVTRVIILSMFSTPEHVVRAMRAGAKGYLLKESAGLEVVDAIRRVHGGERYLSKKISDEIIDDYIQRFTHEDAPSPLESLSDRERQVLQLVVEGNSSNEIAQILSISDKTVDTYRSRLMLKLDINDLPALVKFAIQHGITPLK